MIWKKTVKRANGFLIIPYPLWYGYMRWIIGPPPLHSDTQPVLFFTMVTWPAYATVLRIDYRLSSTGGAGYKVLAGCMLFFPLLCKTMHGLRWEHASIIALSLRWRDILFFFNHSLVQWRWSQKTVLNSHWSCSWSGSVCGTGKSEK